jgi:hypothetical protein
MPSHSHIEIEEFVTPERVEYAYGLAQKYQALGRQSFADVGWRAARARDPKLLLALEKGAEIVDKMTEQQFGRTMREPGQDFGKTKGTTVQNMWREAYRMCDEGTPLQNFEWVYGAAAWLCGYGG